MLPGIGLARAKVKTQQSKRQGTLYMVLAVDTEPRPANGDDYSVGLDVQYLSDQSDSGEVARLMRDDWRRQYRDSEGGLPKITWFAMTSEQVCDQLGCEAVFQQLANFKTDVNRWGDEIGWHYHHTDLTVVDTGTVYRWNQLISFDGTAYTNGSDVQICENSLNHLVADLDFFPTVYRAGWCWENNDFSRWIENVIPFDLSCYSPKSFDWPEYLGSRAKEFDWTRAPLTWRPFHPDISDYQRPGAMKRYLSRCVVGFGDDDIRLIKQGVDSGEDQLFAWATHSYGDIAHEFDIIIGYMAHVCDSLGITYRFAGATDAFRQTLGIRAQSPPKVTLEQRDSIVTISARGDIFQSAPYVVALGRDSSLERLYATKIGARRWSLVVHEPLPQKLYAAISDLNGNAVIETLELAPTKPASDAFTNKRNRRHR
jgi:hypothetical protein